DDASDSRRGAIGADSSGGPWAGGAAPARLAARIPGQHASARCAALERRCIGGASPDVLQRQRSAEDPGRGASPSDARIAARADGPDAAAARRGSGRAGAAVRAGRERRQNFDTGRRQGDGVAVWRSFAGVTGARAYADAGARLGNRGAAAARLAQGVRLTFAIRSSVTAATR